MTYDVSIIICVFNHEKWIERCLRSILNQNYVSSKNYEAVVVNDASSDASLEVINKFRSEPNITIIDNDTNLGLPTSINKAIKISTGRYIVRVDSDDYIQRNFCSLNANIFRYE